MIEILPGFRGTSSRYGRVAHLAAKIRSDQEFPIDPSICINNLGYRLKYKYLATTLWGLTNFDAKVVTVHDELPNTLKRETIGHEIGHIVIRQNFDEWSTVRNNEELYASKFSWELLVPITELTKGTQLDVSEAMQRFEVDEKVILSQLATQGILPHISRASDGTVICSTCGYHPPIFRWCECVVQRNT